MNFELIEKNSNKNKVRKYVDELLKGRQEDIQDQIARTEETEDHESKAILVDLERRINLLIRVNEHLG